MKKKYGFSILELFLFLCIAGILIFLSIPFLKFLPLSNTTEPTEIHLLDSTKQNESNDSLSPHDVEGNQTRQQYQSP